ncbi:hypothetical protein [Holophaga foetida]|uniref:hypothetical protein n=1 Tax=Holophaga foetida TaxID=35839 RepID=UPI0002474955|nr:hypothetical protein [Holophaga foetida]
MAFLKSPLTALIILGPILACVTDKPVAVPPPAAPARPQGGSAKPKAPDVKSLRGLLAAETIRQIAAFKCEMTEIQASLVQSVSLYLVSRDQEPYTATQSRIDRFTILTIHAKGMTRERAEDLASCAPRERIRSYGWDKVILANDLEGWAFDMAPTP